jgi:protein gp37
VSSQSSIEWTDATWNPVRGCTKISPGCKYCYAEVFAERFRGVVGHAYERGFDLRLVPEKLAEPLRWGKSRMIFVNSMSDLFHERVPDDYIVKVAEVMSLANWHVFQVLTKRAERMKKLLQTSLRRYGRQKHIWWGVSVENVKHGLPRIDPSPVGTGHSSVFSGRAASGGCRQNQFERDFLGDRWRRKRP